MFLHVLFCRSFDIAAYTAFLTMIVSTLYVSRTLFEHIKKKRQSNNQVAPIPTISGSVRRRSRQQVPQIQLNNNQFNPEIVNSRFLLLVVFIHLVIVGMIFFFVFGSDYLPDDTIHQTIKRLADLGIIPAVGLTFFMSYPYISNDRLRRFIADEYFR